METRKSISLNEGWKTWLGMIKKRKRQHLMIPRGNWYGFPITGRTIRDIGENPTGTFTERPGIGNSWSLQHRKKEFIPSWHLAEQALMQMCI